MVNVLARSPGNLNEVVVSRKKTFTCVVIIFCSVSFIEFHCLKQILEVMFSNAGIRSGSATVVLELTSVGSKVRSCKLSACHKTC